MQFTSPTKCAAESSISQLKGRWTGTLDQFSHDTEGTFPFTLTIDTITGDEFTGTIDWPAFNNCRTRVQGIFDGKLIKWSETEYLRGDDVVLHGLYIAKFKSKSEIAGDWMDPKNTIYPAGPNYGVRGATFVLKKK